MSSQILSTQTLHNAIPAFILDRRTRGLTPGTIAYYYDELTRFAEWYKSPIIQLTPATLRTYLDHLSHTRNHGGVHCAWRAIRAFLRWWAVEYEPADWTCPTDKIKVNSPSRAALPGVDLYTVRRLIHACYGENALRDKTIFLVLLDTGIRCSELLSLDVDNFDYATGALRILHGKGDKARTVFLGKVARRSLRKYLADREVGPLFLTDEGERMKRDGLVSIMRRRAARAGISPPPKLHDFRRAFAINMLKNGCDLARLAALLGHETLEITRRYLKFVDSDLQLSHAMASPVDRLKL